MLWFSSGRPGHSGYPLFSRESSQVGRKRSKFRSGSSESVLGSDRRKATVVLLQKKCIVLGNKCVVEPRSTGSPAVRLKRKKFLHGELNVQSGPHDPNMRKLIWVQCAVG